VVLAGFQFTGARGLSVPVGDTHIQISRNLFQLAPAVRDGVFIQVTGPGSAGMAERTWIHHNYFLDHSYRGGNGGESVRLGLSSRQHSSAHALVEENLFERCNGDLEAISVKSSDDVIRNNTLRDTRGTISLRHGWGSVVEGNYLLGGARPAFYRFELIWSVHPRLELGKRWNPKLVSNVSCAGCLADWAR
jgi:poly(beta-D-mannuronate) lyase